MKDPLFHRFEHYIKLDSLPEKFTYPFNYDPHPLAVAAAELVKQKFLLTNVLDYDFGLDGDGLGKMFGVLVVKNEQEELGFLAGFSGRIGDQNKREGFVPPVFDILELDGFFKLGEAEIIKINQRVLALESDPDYLLQVKTLDEARMSSKAEITALQLLHRENKEMRKHKRSLVMSIATDKADYQPFLDIYNNESSREHYMMKDLKRNSSEKISNLEKELQIKVDVIDALKIQRKEMSAALQSKIFESFKFLNSTGEWKDLLDIFKITNEITPPSGAGECAAPKLFQYAFRHQYKPIALAEFWWGKTPSSEIRKHEQYYPACKGKCEPILGHMLSGIQLDTDPVLLVKQNLDLDIIYEDEVILAINKPHDTLSVPGKKVEESLYQKLREILPDATGPLNVHRLDMATSGVLLIAKSMETYHYLQSQFIKRQVGKTYIAILDGVVTSIEGIIDLPMRVDLDNRPRQLVCYEHGKSAQTQYKVLNTTATETRILFHPITGRTHQLRVHASHNLGLHCPIKGDDLYGKKGDRLYLHAESITFKHPLTKDKMTISVPAPF